MKVLFVDDEARVLESIERSLFALDLDWEIEQANSGADALQKIRAGDFNVIVTDVRMPGMDGTSLLEFVKDECPEVARVVLSGQADEQSTRRLIHLAHQCLSKPCSTEHLIAAVQRASVLHSALVDPHLRGCIGRIDGLPSAPVVFQTLSTMLERDDVDVRAVAEVVGRDPAIASQVLQVANSSFFRASQIITDTQTAVGRLGTRLVKDIALSTEAFERARRMAPSMQAVIRGLQQRSLAIASTARFLATGTPFREQVFTAGLLCDVGELAILQGAASSDDLAVLRTADHTAIGAVLLELWGIPSAITQAVAAHHQPRSADDDCRSHDLVYLAASLVEGLPVDEGWVKRHRLEKSIAGVRELLAAETLSWA